MEGRDLCLGRDRAGIWDRDQTGMGPGMDRDGTGNDGIAAQAKETLKENTHLLANQAFLRDLVLEIRSFVK